VKKMARNDTKKFDYLRFSFDFINDKPLKDLMEFSGGKCTMCDYQVILLAAGEKGGTLIYEGIFPTMAEQIAAHLNETTPYKITPEEVNQVLKYFISAGYIKVCGNQYEFLQAPLLIKHETGAARRKRKQRLKHKKVKILTGTLSPDIVTLSPDAETLSPVTAISDETLSPDAETLSPITAISSETLSPDAETLSPIAASPGGTLSPDSGLSNSHSPSQIAENSHFPFSSKNSLGHCPQYNNVVVNNKNKQQTNKNKVRDRIDTFMGWHIIAKKAKELAQTPHIQAWSDDYLEQVREYALRHHTKSLNGYLISLLENPNLQESLIPEGQSTKIYDPNCSRCHGTGTYVLKADDDDNYNYDVVIHCDCWKKYRTGGAAK
jgi:predicted DCC family thiol-disulfide oxidoreductase YuxK